MGKIRNISAGLISLGFASLAIYHFDAVLPKTKPIEIERGAEVIYQLGKPYVEGTPENLLEYLLNEEPSKLEKALENLGGHYGRNVKREQ